MAARLEAATRQFQVPLLVSGSFHSLLTPQMAERCRRIDKVKVKGSAQPMPLYCFDIYPGLIDELRPRVEPRLSERVAAHVLKNGEAIKKPHAPERVYSQTLYALDRKQTAASATASTAAAATSPRGASGKPLSRVASLGGGASGGGAALYQVTINGQTIRSIDWSLDPQLAVIQAGLDPAFARMCALGVEQYLDGDWPAATETLQAVIDRFGHDGPTSVLLSYMRNRECTAPADWDGCRALTSK